MKNNNFKPYLQLFLFSFFCIIIFDIDYYRSVNNYNIEKIKKEVTELREQNEIIKEKYKNLLNYTFDMSSVANEKRKAVFELKSKQDSILINLLKNDIRSNQEIIKLLNTEWLYNDSTVFESLKTK